ncbi:MAG: DUF4250 domain-containing protein [Clostridia bacterium]|nr:DUF4250 domain-containing protein [Clostridia bacterium]
MSTLPQDPVMLLSYVNTKLRDNYPSFSRFCEEEDANGAEITAALAAIGYSYDPETNKFV